MTREPSPAAVATFWASTTWNRSRFSRIVRWVSTGKRSHTVSGPNGLFNRNVAPGAATSRTSSRSRKLNWWQATKLAWPEPIRYVERMGRGPNRRWDVVIEPDFFES